MNSNRKILVCDDEPSIVEVTKIILETNGFQVKVCTTSKGILKQVQEYHPDLIFLDIWMPGVNGKEATIILKRHPKTKDIPIILISAVANIEEEVSKCGANGYLKKPFNLEDLVQIASST